MTLDIARWDTVSGWRNHFLVMTLGELCFVYEDVVADIVKYIAEIAGITTKCPLLDGTYGGENGVVQLAPLRHFPSLPYGRYKVHILVGYMKPSRQKELRACLKVIADVVPK
ncbi:Type III secretion ATP synthase HrcN [Frankliniella fusca]|uniref:Type III secretion ATP synthase HrcN n=1 Tax=Frankliniella fusca TaxID=407009 RepID=A0AAE1H565_9NEOP|nr:Type III secretion ATP synthase HrcN [Frankliniella fusca]